MFKYNVYGDDAQIAREIVSKSIFERREWTKADIKAEFDISDAKLELIKRIARRGVAPREFGVTWGYDPDIKRYRVAPTDDGHSITRRIIEFYARSAADEVQGVGDMAFGAYRQGHVTEKSAGQVIKNSDDLEYKVSSLSDQLEWTDAK